MRTRALVEGSLPGRRLVVCLVAAVALYVSIGHAFHRANMADDATMHGAGICLVLFTLAAAAGLIQRPRPLPAGVPAVGAPDVPATEAPAAAPRAIARASPVWLRRFLN